MVTKKNARRFQKSNNKYFFRIAWFVLLFLISALLARYVLTGINDMLAIGHESTTVQVEIPEGAQISTVADVLKQNGLIQEKEFFILYATATKSAKNFVPGYYELNTSMDYQSLLNHIQNQSNVRDIVDVTFTEGMNVMECADLLDKNKICNKDKFLELCKSNEFDESFSFLKNIDNPSERIYKLEGYLFPDTYKFYHGEEASGVINKILTNYKKQIIQKNTIEGYGSKVSIKELAEKNGMNVENLITIASLIQAEAADKDDMYKVSSVIHNRLSTLNSGGKNSFGEFSMNYLRIDATVYYPYRTKKNVPKNLQKNFTGLYNTYNIQGLPPGPICNPGMDAILAALNPAHTDYYYYCHSSEGESFYAKTNDAHLANLRKAGL